MKNRPGVSRQHKPSAANTQAHKKPSNWKKAILSNAVALAGAGLSASAAFAACPGVQNAGTRTLLCTLTGTDSSTVTTTGSIKVAGPSAINVTAAATSTTISNAGTISATSTDGSDVEGIHFNGSFNGTITNTGTILGQASDYYSASAIGIYIDDDFAAGSSLTNSGTITGNASSGDGGEGGYGYAEATGVYIDEDLEGTITNSAGGVIQGIAEGESASAAGVLVYYTLGATGSITNNGTIRGQATATTDDATAYGIYIDDYMEGSINNSGTVEAIATGENDASAYGIYLSSTMTEGSELINSGTVSATATTTNSSAEAQGIYIYDMEGATFTNTASGAVTATASGDYANATGVYVSSMDGTSVFTNAGTISASATGDTESAEAYGIYLDSTLVAGAQLINSGTITATAQGVTEASAYGIYLSSTVEAGAILTNSGTITASATGGAEGGSESAGAYAAGIFVEESLQSILDNSGTITATATGTDAQASGIAVYALGQGNIDVVAVVDEGAPVSAEGTGEGGSEPTGQAAILNSGSITATATGTASAQARGIWVYSAMGERIESSGDITATASSTAADTVEAYGILIDSIMTSTGTVDNSGTISVSATGEGAPTGEAIGIHAVGIYLNSGMEAGATLTNSGTINATAAGVDAEASGIRVDFITAGAVANSGNIAVTGGADIGAHGILVNTTLAASGSVENSGTITASGPGGETSGTAGIYIWNMEAGATLNNSGTITASPVEGVFSLYVQSGQGNSVGNSGRLDGDIHLAGTSLANTGTVAMPVGVTGFIGGDYTQSGSGVLEVGVMSSSAGGYGRLVVDGTADVSANNQVSVNVSANDQLVDEEIIQDILSAGTLVTGAELTATDNSALWDFTAFNDGENNIDLGVIRGLFIADAVMENGPDWALGAAQSLDAIIEEGPEGDMATVIGAFGALETTQEVAAAAAQTVPVLVAQGLQMASLSMANLGNATINRLATQKGLASGDQLMTDRNLWVKPFGSSGEQDTRDGVPGYDVDNYGFVLGYDQVLNDAWTLGGAIGYSDIEANLNSSELNHTLDVTSAQLAAYADWKVNQDMFVDLIGVLGSSDNDSQRRIRIGTLDRKAEGSYDSWYGRAYAGLGRNFVRGDVTMTPVVSTTYTYIEDDSYTEKGADSLNLDVEDNDIDSFVIALDGRVAYAMNETSLLTGHLGVGYDTIADAAVLTSTFVGGGPAFRTEGPEPDDTILQAGAGVELRASESIEVFVNYEYEGRDDFENNSLIATVRWTF